MNMKKLLATTAIAAMAATSASAGTLTFHNGAGDSDVGLVAQQALASEVAEATGVFSFTLIANDPIPDADNILIRVQLPNGFVFDGTVASSSLVMGNTAIAGATGVNDATDVIIADAGTGVAISSGGADESSVVVFIVNSSPADDIIVLNLAVKTDANACGAPNGLSVGLATENGVPIESGGDGTTSPFGLEDGAGDPEDVLACEDGFGLVGAAQGTDDELALASFEDFTVAGPAGDNLVAIIGTIGGDDLDGVADAEFNIAANAPSSFGGAALDDTDVDMLEFSVTLEDSTGVDDVAVDIDGDGFADISGTQAGNVWSFEATGSDKDDMLDGTPDTVIVLINQGAAGTELRVEEQDISFSDIVATFTNAAGGTAFAAGSTLIDDKTFAGGAFDSLTHEGTSAGPFDWVGDASKGSRNLFRMTGAGAATSISGEVIFTNSSEGMDGTFPYTFNFSNGEGQVFSAGGTQNMSLDDVNPGFGRADVQFNFFASAPTDVDRLLLRGDVLSNFGNNAGSAGVNNGDD